MFVLSEGELLDYADYEPSNQMFGYNTSKLVKGTIKCAVNKTDTGYSCLNAGQDPPLDTANQVPFKNAKSLLYKVYPQEISEYYQGWITIYLLTCV